MFRVLVLIGAILFFRAALPRTTRWSPTATSPYRNGLDGMISAQQVSSMLDEVMPYEAWLASRRASVQHASNAGDTPSESPTRGEPAPSAACDAQRETVCSS